MFKHQGALIKSIVTVSLEEILLELHLNLSHPQSDWCLSMELEADAESIKVDAYAGWKSPSSFAYEIFDCRFVQSEDALSLLLDSAISTCRTGFCKGDEGKPKGKTYFHLHTTTADLLFFNNGDHATFALSGLDEIIKAGICEPIWMDGWNTGPAILL